MGTSSVACGATFPSGARLFVSQRLQGYTRAEKPAGQGFLCHRACKVIPERKSRQGADNRGSPKVPAAEKIDVDANGTITGLF
ncbi:MAG: formate--tetrahydrofolate ligase [Ruminococcaceae bacterium]|nr:formate--tetrahydrofolate ligase [Oscillospiraceae bacterium]